MNCLVCNKEIGKKAKKYCSLTCHQESIYNQNVEDWLSGKKSGIRGKNATSKFIRRYLMKRCDCKCERCGWNQINNKTKKVPLTLNHKDGNWKNNIVTNLEMLCPNCHSLTANYGSLNRGFGREKY